jgi:tripartite-type tricarboxylate transporter receptor subunit TctC
VDGPTPSWFALFVPAGTPAQAIGRLNGAAVAAAADKPLVERTLQQGIEVRSSSPAQLADLLKSDYETNSVLVKELG